MTVDISSMTPVASVAGTEFLPASAAGAPKSITPAQLKTYIIDGIEAIAAGTVIAGTDKIFVLESAAIKPLLASTVAAYVNGVLWGKTAETVVDAADIIPLKDGGTTEKTVTAAILATYIRSTITGTDINVAGLDASGTLADANLFIVSQSGANKKVALSALKTALLAGLDAYVGGLTAVTACTDADVFYTAQSGVGKKATLTQIKAQLNPVMAPAASTENSVPQWASASKTLKDGLTVQTTVRPSATAADTALATEKAVRTAIETPTVTGGASTPACVRRFGATATEGLETYVFDGDITLGAIAGAAVLTIPAEAVIRCLQANLSVAAVAGGTTAKVGLGVAADPDLYGKTTALTKNLKIDTMLDYNKLAAEVILCAFPVTSAGAIGDTAFTAGTLRVRIVYDVLNSLDDE